MTSRDNPLPRKHSTENRDPITTNPSIQSSLGSNPTVFTETEEVHLPIGLEDKTSTYTTRSNQFGFEEHQEKRYKDDLEEEKTSPEAANSNKREGFTGPGPQILSPDAFPQYDSPERNFDELRREQADREGHKIYGKYFEEYQKKYPSDLQHLRVSKQLSSPEMKKSDMPAFRRICNNNSLGDTIISEFTQGPIPDKESNSKSSKMSSNENLVNLERPENIEPGIRRQTVIKEERKESMTLKDIDSSINNTTSNLRIDADILKNSELEALAKKRAQKMNAPMDFNVMVAGASGLGKSTFIDCFLESKYHVQHAIRPKTKEICEKTGSRTYNGMTFNINLIDTRGFTHSDSMEEWYREIRGEITRRFDEYKAEKEKSETQKRPQGLRTKDRRIHLLLYFFSGHRIESKDLQAMKKLQKYCAIVPILAKGDLFSLDEVREIKQSLLEKQKIYKLEWFDFHAALKNDQLKLNEFNNSRFGPCPPFVIVSSVNKVKIGSNLYVMGREYVWGVCNIENPNHSDFKLLQSLLGGFICFDAVQNTRLYYKEYKKAAKERKKKDEEKDRQKTQIGIGAAVAIGLVGTVFALKKKFTF